MGVVALISAIFSFLLSNALIGSPQKNPVKVPVVHPISSEFPSPQTDARYKKFFNDKALDPTQLIEIGDSKNKEPFQSGQQ